MGDGYERIRGFFAGDSGQFSLRGHVCADSFGITAGGRRRSRGRNLGGYALQSGAGSQLCCDGFYCGRIGARGAAFGVYTRGFDSFGFAFDFIGVFAFCIAALFAAKFACIRPANAGFGGFDAAPQLQQTLAYRRTEWVSALRLGLHGFGGGSIEYEWGFGGFVHAIFWLGHAAADVDSRVFAPFYFVALAAALAKGCACGGRADGFVVARAGIEFGATFS